MPADKNQFPMACRKLAAPWVPTTLIELCGGINAALILGVNQMTLESLLCCEYLQLDRFLLND